MQVRNGLQETKNRKQETENRKREIGDRNRGIISKDVLKHFTAPRTSRFEQANAE
jgi:hypothetical protein